jgi:hypothetical protein
MRINPVTNGLQVLATSFGSNEMRFWEYKDRNIHRGIIDYELASPLSKTQIEADVRNKVIDAYTPTWARGFAFGTVIQLNDSPDYPLEVFATCVDGLNKSNSVWQWVIVIDHQKHFAYAAHMWMRGSLHPMFESTVNYLSERGYKITTEYLEKPRPFRGIHSYLNFAPKAIEFLKKLQLALIAVFLAYITYSYFS